MYIKLICALLAIIFLVLITQLFPRMTLPATVIYYAFMIYFVGFAGGRGGAGGISFHFPLPFWEAIIKHHYGLTTNRSLLNLLLFIPFGYLVSSLMMPIGVNSSAKEIKKDRKDFRKVRSAIGLIIIFTGFMFSLCIEILQLVFRRGILELDDLVKNTMGAAIGWMIWAIMEKINYRRNSKRGK